MKALISVLWLLIFTKKLFFWSWLWQLKEYHFGRFKAHFQTEKGKKLILNKLLILKLFLLGGIVYYFSFFLYFLVLVFLLESIFVLKQILFKSLKVPVLTKKTFLILICGIFLEFLILYYLVRLNGAKYYFSLLFLDIFAPLFFSGLVLSFQPVTLFWRKRLIEKAKKKREKFKDLLVIGITGSYGKTSTKEFLAEILSQKFNVLKTKKHQNSEVGISQCILNDLKKEHQIFVCEMGAYNKGGIKLLCEIARPKIGIITGVNEQHLAVFGSMENLLSAEGGKELIESLPKEGFVVLNGNNKYCRELYQKVNLKKKLAGKDIKAQNIEVKKEFLSFKIDSVNFKINLLGEFWIENILMAILVAKELGMNLKEISKACQKIKPLPGAMKLIKTKSKLNIIDATYSANPNGVISHLEYLKLWRGKKVIVMPCLIELGEASERVHKNISQKIREICDLAIITTKECFPFLKKEAKEKVIFLQDSEKIFKKIKKYSGKEDIILLESRVPGKLLDLLEIKERTY